jgi:hypothetical protein
MRKFLLVCCATLFTCGAALAQSDVAATNVSTIAAPTPAASTPEAPAAPQVVSRLDLANWQLAFTYEFNEFYMPQRFAKNSNVPAFTARDNGYNVGLTRYLVSWGGLEVDAGQGFGGTSTTQIKHSKFLFIGGGPHFALRGHRAEPWAHVLFGLNHFRFSGTATQYGSNNTVEFLGGMGVDFHLNQRTAFRISGDYVGTILFNQPQTSWQAGAGVVFNF